jgi:preprotein translocase subunit SecE
VSDSSAVRGGRKSDSGGKPAEKRTGPVTFYRQVVAELRKVVYPTREQLVTYFFVVLVFVLVMIALVSLLDLGFGKLVFEIFTT